MEIIVKYLSESSPVTFIVLGVLSLYLFITFWIFFYRFIKLDKAIKKEAGALHIVLSKKDLPLDSIFSELYKKPKNDPESLQMLLALNEKESTNGLTFLSICASTSPFIGLFGTVVSILESFSKIGSSGSASLSTVAPVISEALVATAAGILVAIFAYTFHLILKRYAFGLHHYLSIHAHYLSSRNH